MKLCDYCGELIDDDSVFCVYCGRRVEDEVDTQILTSRDAGYSIGRTETTAQLEYEEDEPGTEVLTSNKVYGQMRFQDTMDKTARVPQQRTLQVPQQMMYHQQMQQQYIGEQMVLQQSVEQEKYSLLVKKNNSGKNITSLVAALLLIVAIFVDFMGVGVTPLVLFDTFLSLIEYSETAETAAICLAFIGLPWILGGAGIIYIIDGFKRIAPAKISSHALLGVCLGIIIYAGTGLEDAFDVSFSVADYSVGFWLVISGLVLGVVSEFIPRV